MIHNTFDEQKMEIMFLYLRKVADIWYRDWLDKVDTLN